MFLNCNHHDVTVLKVSLPFLTTAHPTVAYSAGCDLAPAHLINPTSCHNPTWSPLARYSWLSFRTSNTLSCILISFLWAFMLLCATLRISVYCSFISFYHSWFGSQFKYNVLEKDFPNHLIQNKFLFIIFKS